MSPPAKTRLPSTVTIDIPQLDSKLSGSSHGFDSLPALDNLEELTVQEQVLEVVKEMSKISENLELVARTVKDQAQQTSAINTGMSKAVEELDGKVCDALRANQVALNKIGTPPQGDKYFGATLWEMAVRSSEDMELLLKNGGGKFDLHKEFSQLKETATY